jgi:hypothetical protein
MLENHLPRRAILAYVPQDQEFLPDLEGMLEKLCHKQLLTSWESYNVEGKHVSFLDAEILLLLISPFFVASSFFSQGETNLLKMHEKRIVCSIPILLRYTFWYDHALASLKALPPDGFGGAEPIAGWKNRPIALKEISNGIVPIVEAFEHQQLTRLSGFLQEVLDTIEQGQTQELLAHGLREYLFAICDRVKPLMPERFATLFERLAEVTKDDQDDFSQRCVQRVATIRLQLSEQFSS